MTRRALIVATLLLATMGCARPSASAALAAAQVAAATQRLPEAALVVPGASLAAGRAVEAAQRLLDAVTAPAWNRYAAGRQVGAALTDLERALSDVATVPEATPDLRARVALAQALALHVRLALAPEAGGRWPRDE